MSLFHSPWYLLLLIIPLLLIILRSRAQQAAVQFSSLASIKQMPVSMRQRLLWLPSLLGWLAMVCLIIALARPREGREQVVTDDQGIAIEMVVDRSSSMLAMDFEIDNAPVDRLTAIKNVAKKFVLGEDELSGRVSDLIGLITFAGYADNQTPLTLDHRFLVDQLATAEIVNMRQEDGTAIGDAIALAVEKLNALDEREQAKVASKVIILLTDGENTAGQLDPQQAAELAKTIGVRIYTIGVGTKGQAPVPMRDSFSGRLVTQMMQVNIDEATLTNIAQLTGGRYFRATDTDSLQRIYAEIDQLEKVEVESRTYVDYRELAVQSLSTQWGSLPPILMWAMGLLGLKMLLSNTWLRQLNDA